MLINYDVTITGSKCVLVPYRKEHVETYHVWMQDGTLQELTESEPLTTEQEYEMQHSWAVDEDKCTFIILDSSLPDTPRTGAHGGRMAGDVNLFFNDDDRTTAEIEVMIAETASRRKGIAREALHLLMAYAYKTLGVKVLRAKILDSNAPSITLFTQLGYEEVKRVAVFHEVHMELDLGREGPQQQAIKDAAASLALGSYDGSKAPA